MQDFDQSELKKLYTPPSDSHKGQNGKLLLIGGSHLFHAASLWSLKIASRIVDMVFYSSVPENNQIVLEAKKEFHDGIVVPREQLEDYVQEADCILLGPGMVRSAEPRISSAGLADQISNLNDIEKLHDEGEQTYFLTKYLLQKYPSKKWVLDAGALQMMNKEWLRSLEQVVLTPHVKEFERLFGVSPAEDVVAKMATEYGCIILQKGQEDIVCPPSREAGSADTCTRVAGGNAGMTKGGTGDVLAGLVAALACKNELFLAACAGSYINKRAGDALSKKVGYYFNSSDLVEEIPRVMHELFQRQHNA